VVSAVLLFVNLPDADAFNAAITDIFVNADIRDPDATQMLLIMAETGTTFSGVLASYRAVMFVLMVFAAALLIACLVFLATIVTLNRRIGEIERTGIQVSSLILSREERVVLINNLEFKLTEAAMETLSVLAEARLDDEVLTGAQIEAMISGKHETDVGRGRGRHADQAAAGHARQPAGQRASGQEHRAARLRPVDRQGRDPDDLAVQRRHHAAQLRQPPHPPDQRVTRLPRRFRSSSRSWP
jgi:hypothetical protein